MPIRYSVLAGKTIQQVARLRGGGSALPGLVIERVDPGFMARTLEQLPYGVVLISGTNGKTTTTKMTVELLESQGLKVFTNRTGSNFTRGVTAALLGEVDNRGNLDADIAVLELDEAHAVHFVRKVAPRFSLFLNVMRDQLDRFGEIDTTAKLLRKIAETTTDGIVTNRDDPRLSSSSFLADLPAETIRTFGVDQSLLDTFPSDDSLREKSKPTIAPTQNYTDNTLLKSLDETGASVEFDGKTHQISLKLKGLYNVQNAVAAVALTRLVMADKLDISSMLAALSTVEPAFGRGESIMVDGQPVELVLVKNPSGFRLGLSSFEPEGVAVMIAVNDRYADGRDMSWLWDVEFESLMAGGVDMVSGVRAYDMALRLQYDQIPLKNVETNLTRALNSFLATNPDKPRRIFCTYTAMLAIRRSLSKRSNVETVK